MSNASSFSNPPGSEDDRLKALARYDILDTPPEPAFDRVARLVQMIFGVTTSAVSLIDAHRQWIKAGRGLDFTEVALSNSFCNQAIREKQALVVRDLTEDDRFRDNPYVTGDPNVRFYAGTPIRTPDGHNIGTVCAMDSGPRNFSEKDVAILEELAEIVMDEIELRRLASTDGLTGLSTRRAFKEEAERFVELARRHRSTLSAISFDIDHFKTINDTYGHAAGDMVLKAISEVAAATPRQSDIVGRLGGEEFALVLPGADINSALAVAEKLRLAVSALQFPGSQPPFQVTASFGVAALDPGRDDLESLLIKADEALYDAKRNGRDRVVAWTGTLATTKPFERQRVLKAGRLVLRRQNFACDCSVRALWDDGAEVHIASGLDVPDVVTLEIPDAAMSWEGRVVLRRPNGLELQFL
ncbi:sensor domain-containing diguanylate cyclase [Devosia sp. BK]|uniref:sensor domain-containing diguanylate cyclase n=1 Tax=Devosia sp. BK TaxID=2871706 RepID=UPI00293A3F9E|nr:sensor domain-containing diguanylate cyclase [Devosia sp. BK]MDV3252507.1 sensor domain-containing diguanylate cyclase [Devosia sp. BK]